MEGFTGTKGQEAVLHEVSRQCGPVLSSFTEVILNSSAMYGHMIGTKKLKHFVRMGFLPVMKEFREGACCIY